MSNVHARCARGKISLANNIADNEEEILQQANLLLILVLKRRHRQLEKRRKHRFWVRKIFMKRQKLGAFYTLLRELRVSDRTVTNINEHSGFVAKKFWIIWVRIKIIMGYVSIADRRTLVSIWSQDRKRSQTIAEDRTWFYLLRLSAITIADDRKPSQKWVSIWSQTIAELSAIYDLRFAIVCDHMETSLKFPVSGSWSTRVFETQTAATGSELFSLLTCFHTIIFSLLRSFLHYRW